MKTTGHHAGTVTRLAVIAIGIAVLASCASTGATTVDGVETADVALASGSATYAIGTGDTLSGIADRAGVSVADIVAANGWSDGSDHLIVPGDVITLPQGASTPTPKPAAPAATTKSADTGSTTAPAGGGTTIPADAMAPCDAFVIIEAIGDDTADFGDAWCQDGWAWMNPNNYGDVPTPWILKAEGQTWVLQDRNTVCDPNTDLPWPVPAYCPGG